MCISFFFFFLTVSLSLLFLYSSAASDFSWSKKKRRILVVPLHPFRVLWRFFFFSLFSSLFCQFPWSVVPFLWGDFLLRFFFNQWRRKRLEKGYNTSCQIWCHKITRHNHHYYPSTQETKISRMFESVQTTHAMTSATRIQIERMEWNLFEEGIL